MHYPSGTLAAVGPGHSLGEVDCLYWERIQRQRRMKVRDAQVVEGFTRIHHLPGLVNCAITMERSTML